MTLAASACTGLELSATEQHIDAPQMVTATAVTDKRISVSWTSVPGAFKYYVIQSDGGPFVYVASVLEPDTSYLAIGLVPDTTYAYQIIAVSTDNSESAPSDPPASATTFAVAPGAPTDIVARAISGSQAGSQVDVSWSTVADAVKYYVFESESGGGFTYRATVLSPDATFSAINLLANTLYCYRLVTSFPDGSESAGSAPSCAVTADGPDGVLATAVSDTSIQVQWQPAADAVKYFVFESQAGGPYTFRGTAVGDASFLVVNLTPATEYCYRVSTVFPNGAESALSAASCDTTFAPEARRRLADGIAARPAG